MPVENNEKLIVEESDIVQVEEFELQAAVYNNCCHGYLPEQ